MNLQENPNIGRCAGLYCRMPPLRWRPLYGCLTSLSSRVQVCNLVFTEQIKGPQAPPPTPTLLHYYTPTNQIGKNTQFVHSHVKSLVDPQLVVIIISIIKLLLLLLLWQKTIVVVTRQCWCCKTFGEVEYPVFQDYIHKHCLCKHFLYMCDPFRPHRCLN